MLAPNQIFAERYRVVRHIADGGMGAVYEAEHVATEARVALKLLLPHVVQLESARRRFELEAKVAARVKSDHIVKVFDAGLDAETRSPYLAMELLIGQTLAAQVDQRGALGPEAVIDVMRQVADGLDAAHGYRGANGSRQPIVHRDLKPENLFVATRSDGSPLVKILDFGIAKVASEATEVSQELRGTPLYMAFEQAAGEAVSPQTDIWALGLITFFALTGRRYWSAANKPNGSAQALFAEILTRPLPLPSERVHEEGLRVALPPGFDAWMLTCIDRTPSRRFGSAGQAVDALERALSGSGHRPVLGGPGGGRPRPPARSRYESPTTPVAAGLSSGSVTGVTSEHRSALQQTRGKPTLLLAVGAISACAIGLGIAWRWLDAGRVGQGDAAASIEPHRSPASSPSVELRFPLAPAASGPNADVASDARGAPDRETTVPGARTPRVSVERHALTPAPPAANASATTREPSPPRAEAAAKGAPAPADSSPAPAPKAPPRGTRPAKPSEDEPCEFFDPYAGRCMSASSGSARAP